MRLLPSLRPTFTLKRRAVGSLPPPQPHWLLLSVVALLVEGAGSGCKFAHQEVFSSSHCQPLAPNPGAEIPTGAEERLAFSQHLGRKVASCPLQVLQRGQPGAPEALPPVEGERGLRSSPGARQLLSRLPFFSSPSSDFPLLPPSSTQKIFFVYGGNT